MYVLAVVIAASHEFAANKNIIINQLGKRN